MSNNPLAPSSEANAQRRMTAFLVVGVLLALAGVGIVFRKELFGVGENTNGAAEQASILADGASPQRLRIGKVTAKGGLFVLMDLTPSPIGWMDESTGTLANQRLVSDLLAALRTAEASGHALSVEKAALIDLGLEEQSPNAIVIEGFVHSPTAPDFAIVTQGGRFRERDSTDVYRFPMVRVPSKPEAWLATEVKLLGEQSKPTAITLHGRDKQPLWRVTRKHDSWYLADTDTLVDQARVASMLFYAARLPVIGPVEDVKVALVAWEYELEFTSEAGEPTIVKLARGRANDVRLQCSAAGQGAYRIGTVQASELTPSLRRLLNDTSAEDAPAWLSPSATPDQGGRDPSAIQLDSYRCIVITANNLRFPNAPPSTRTLAEALALATEAIGQLESGAKFASVANQFSDWRVANLSVTDLSLHPSGTPPEDVIEALKSLQPGKFTTHPVAAEDGLYIIWRRP